MTDWRGWIWVLRGYFLVWKGQFEAWRRLMGPIYCLMRWWKEQGLQIDCWSIFGLIEGHYSVKSKFRLLVSGPKGCKVLKNTFRGFCLFFYMIIFWMFFFFVFFALFQKMRYLVKWSLYELLLNSTILSMIPLPEGNLHPVPLNIAHISQFF